MATELVVLSGAPPGTTLEVREDPRFLVIKEENGGSVCGVSLERDAAADDRLVEIYSRGTFCHVKNLRPWQSMSVNGERSYDHGERAVIRHGDVLTIRSVVFRLTASEPEVDKIGGSGPYETIPADIKSKIITSKSAAESAALGKIAGEPAEKVRARVGFLRRIGELALLAQNPTVLLQQTLDALGDFYPKAQGSIMWRVGGSEQFRRVHRVGPGSAADVRVSRTVIMHVLEKKAGVMSEDTTADERLKKSVSIRAQGMRSVLCVPIVRGDRVAGVIHLDASGFGNFGEADLEMVGAAAGTVATALGALDQRTQQITAKVRRVVGESMKRASVLLTPEGGVAAGGLQVAVGYVGDSSTAGGVYADALALVPEAGQPPSAGPVILTVGEVVADAGDTGIGALVARCTIRALAPYGLQPGALVSEIGRALKAAGQEAEGAAVVARWNPPAGELELSAAGNPTVLHHVAAKKACHEVEVGHRVEALGTADQLSGQETRLALAPGDAVVFFTEGLIDAVGGAGRLEGVRAAIDVRAKKGPVDIVSGVIEKARQKGEPTRPTGIVAIRRD